MKSFKSNKSSITKFLNMMIYILRYLLSFKVNYKINKNINFGSKRANKFFYKNLKKCKNYLEYGSGSSSLLAHKNKKKFLSIETDKSFFNLIKNKIKKSAIYIDMGPTKYDAIPILSPLVLKNKIRIYAEAINLFHKTFRNFPDLILIDGRFRVYVTLHIIDYLYNSCELKGTTTIIIDDFKTRSDYKILDSIIKIEKIERFAVIKLSDKNIKKISIKRIKKLKKKYIFDFN